MSADSSPTSSDNTDSWEQWQKVYADRNLRLQLYCRDPNTITPVRSRSVKIMNIPLHTPQRTVLNMFKQVGNVVDSRFFYDSNHPGARCCIIKYRQPSHVADSCKLYDGKKLWNNALSVSAYDVSEECLANQQSSQASIDGTEEIFEDAAAENVVGYLRQAQLQNELRLSKKHTQNNCLNILMPNNEPPKMTIEKRISGEKINNLNCSFDFEAPKVTYTYIKPICELKKFEEKDKVCSVDDIGLDSTSQFWEWLVGKLKFGGPMHFEDQEIADVVQKLPPSAKAKLAWILGALRLYNEKDIMLIGPYVCLKEHVFFGKEKCLSKCLDFSLAYKEKWEPVHPKDIASDRQVLKYIRAMLKQFGPMSLKDGRFGQLSEILAQSDKDDMGKFSAPGVIFELIKTDAHMRILKDKCYLTKEHVASMQSDGLSLF